MSHSPRRHDEHSEDRRRLARVREESDTEVDRPGGGSPVLGVLRDEEAMREARRRAELERRVRRSGERLLDPADAFAEPASNPPSRQKRSGERQRCATIDQRRRASATRRLSSMRPSTSRCGRSFSVMIPPHA